jgi:hypothetical protein
MRAMILRISKGMVLQFNIGFVASRRHRVPTAAAIYAALLVRWQ